MSPHSKMICKWYGTPRQSVIKSTTKAKALSCEKVREGMEGSGQHHVHHTWRVIFSLLTEDLKVCKYLQCHHRQWKVHSIFKAVTGRTSVTGHWWNLSNQLQEDDTFKGIKIAVLGTAIIHRDLCHWGKFIRSFTVIATICKLDCSNEDIWWWCMVGVTN